MLATFKILSRLHYSCKFLSSISHLPVLSVLLFYLYVCWYWFQILRIVVQSKTPDWKVGDLRVTKLKETKKGQILIFKELEWQTVRIEASSTKDLELPPLRLLTNCTRCRVTIKKRLSGIPPSYSSF